MKLLCLNLYLVLLDTNIQLFFDKNINKEVVNIGPDENFITINELYEILSNKLQYNKTAKYYEDRPNEVKYAKCSSNKARKILNYKTTVSLEDSIQKVVDYVKNEGPKKFVYDYEIELNNDLVPITWKKKLF